MSMTEDRAESVFTLANLKSLLKERANVDDERRDSVNLEKNPNPKISVAVREFYQSHGILAPCQHIWKRSLPPTIYKCPLSESTTSLVSWNSLPTNVQRLYERPVDSDDVIEVNSNHLLSEQVWREEGQQPEQLRSLTHGMQRRPLQGNMTNKLSEYTRGVAGRARPFLPGGLDANEEGNVPASDLGQDKFLTPKSIERSLDALKNGSKASWENGTLLTSPNGTNFKIGISHHDTCDVAEQNAEHAIGDHRDSDSNIIVEVDATTNSKEKGSVSAANIVHSSGSALLENLSTQAIQWDKQLLDDDSLFGSSLESDSDSSDSTEGGNDDDASQSDVASDEESRQKATRKEADPDMSAESSIDAEVDNLLLEITQVESRSKIAVLEKKKRQAAGEVDGTQNPLRLVQKQNTLSSTKKSWASTKLLPIQDFSTFVPNPALKYSFTLDPFQEQAVARLERSESVFVAAHTSAGKTVIAEYAVALARQRGTRCIYTSPIKALSNQKFRDFSLKFGSKNVGLVTGDLQVNVDDSTCLIMTTEILRSMLYRGADLIRDIEFVVFDEVHYINDSERGVVWEETIILLPSYVTLIFLSATTPNTFEFSDWIGRTKRKPVFVVRTDHRPVPLSHFLWAGSKLHKVKEGDTGFLEKGYQAASMSLDKTKETAGDGKRKTGLSAASGRGAPSMAWQSQGSKSQWMSLIRFLWKEELTPTVVFTFSKKKCEEVANMLNSLDLTTSKERSAVRTFAFQTVSRLSPVDAALPQVMSACEMVERGIGVHHGGLLPILKEMVEILFSRNLIKVLFATETFAMGVNMPARSVVFNSIRKHDGKQFRVLQPGEYTQMAGRAGRRGLDKVGTVIMSCFGEKPPPIGILKTMLTGTSMMLQSQFRLTYNMILNLLRVEEMSVESMIKRSFSEFATQRALTANEYPKLLERSTRTVAKLADQFEAEASQRLGAEDLKEYFEVCQRLKMTNAGVLSYIDASTGSLDGVLQPGRVLLISAARKFGVACSPAMILSSSRAEEKYNFPSADKPMSFVCMLLLPSSHVGDETEQTTKHLKACSIGEVGFAKGRHYTIVMVEIDQILLVTATKGSIDQSRAFKFGVGHPATGTNRQPSSLINDPFAGRLATSEKKRNDDDMVFGKKKVPNAATSSCGIGTVGDVLKVLLESEQQERTSGLEMLDLSDYLKRGQQAVDFRQLAGTMPVLADEMRRFQSHHHPSIETHFTLLERLSTLRSHVDTLGHLLSNESLLLFPDFQQRKAVLKRLGYLDENEAVTVKGRVACEVNTCEELIVTEIVFEGVLNDLEPPVIVAALSSLIYQEKRSEDDGFDLEIPESLFACCETMKTIAANLGQLQKEQGLDVDPLEYAESSLRFGLVHVVYEWAIGVPFSAITQLTTAQEGSIVRCITRLDELCREVRNCARVVGNPTLYQKMEIASAAIKRDIVFAASLYVS